MAPLKYDVVGRGVMGVMRGNGTPWAGKGEWDHTYQGPNLCVPLYDVW